MSKKCMRFFIWMVCSLFFFSCSTEEGNDTGSSSGKGRRTVLVYMNARNSLRGYVDGDLNEMVRGAAHLDARDRMLVYVCRDSISYLYKVNPEGLKKMLICSPEQNASDQRQLELILRTMQEEYPAESYGLVMWSHSDGWLPSTNVSRIASRGFGIDPGAEVTPGSDWINSQELGYQMNITDLAQAVANSGVNLEFLFFDSCLMQCIEAAYDLRNTATWIVGSPAQMLAIGSEYEDMMKNAFFEQPFDGGIIASRYVEVARMDPDYQQGGAVLSAIKTSELEALAAVTREMLEKYALTEAVPTEEVLHYDYYTRNYLYRPEYYDLKDVMRALITEETDYRKWLAVLDACVPTRDATDAIDYWGSPTYLDPEVYCGVSCFVPKPIYTQNAELCLYGDLNQAFTETEWCQDAGWTETYSLKSVIQE